MLKLKLQFFGHLMRRVHSLVKTQILGKIESRSKRGRRTEDQTVAWHHRLNGHEFEQAPGDGERQGSLACCSPWGHQESDRTEQLNNSSEKQKTAQSRQPFAVSLLLSTVLRKKKVERKLGKRHRCQEGFGKSSKG